MNEANKQITNTQVPGEESVLSKEHPPPPPPEEPEPFDPNEMLARPEFQVLTCKALDASTSSSDSPLNVEERLTVKS